MSVLAALLGRSTGLSARVWAESRTWCHQSGIAWTPLSPISLPRVVEKSREMLGSVTLAATNTEVNRTSRSAAAQVAECRSIGAEADHQ